MGRALALKAYVCLKYGSALLPWPFIELRVSSVKWG